jgi:hypothetical protein
VLLVRPSSAVTLPRCEPADGRARFPRRIGYALTQVRCSSRTGANRDSGKSRGELKFGEPRHALLRTSREGHSGQPRRARHTSAGDRTDAAGGEVGCRDPVGRRFDPSRRAADRAQHRDRLPFVDDDGDLLEVVTRVDALQTLAR